MIASAVVAACAPSAWAGNTVDLGNDTSLNYSVTANYGVAVRTGAQSNSILSPASINGDDGDRNLQARRSDRKSGFLPGKPISRRGDFGVFLRGELAL
ncbi:DUF1302 family protein [Cupriavidus basilensis]